MTGSGEGHGLALSGGGFRATLFHLGVVECLRDCGRLSQLTHISSVSGGSILAAHLVQNWEKYNSDQFESIAGELIKFAKSDVRGQIVRRLPLLFPFQSSSDLVRKRYARLFRNARFQELAGAGRPELHILATNLNRADLTSFSTCGLFLNVLDTEAKPVPNGKVALDAAVAASAAFPLFYAPLRLSAKDIGVTQKALGHAEQCFTDGGVFENSGGRVFLELSKQRKFASILLSEASQRIDWNDAPHGFLNGAVRSIGILQARVADLEQAAIDRLEGCTRIAITEQAIANIRTDMDRFSDPEIKALRAHGYEAARKALGCDAGAGAAKAAAIDDLLLQSSARVRWRLFDRADWVSWLYVAIAVGLLLVFLGPIRAAARSRLASWSSARTFNIETVEELLTGSQQTEEAKRFQRGFRANILTMAFERLPITGDIDSTRQTAIGDHSTCMLQSGTDLVKLQRFELPQGALHVRALSRNTVDAGDANYEARVWTFVQNRAGDFRQLSRSGSQHWPIAPEDAGGRFYIVALYDHETGFFVEPGYGHYSGAEIDDLAGHVDQASFVVGGLFDDIQLKEVWRFAPRSPIDFHEVPTKRIVALSQPKQGCDQAFGPLRDFYAQKLQATPNTQRVMTAWNAASDSRWLWIGFTLAALDSDFIFRVTGSRATQAGGPAGR